MKAVSLWEPWATLVALKLKTYETRHWRHSYRGPLLICAAKGGLSKRALNDLLDGYFPFGIGDLLRNRLNFGHAVAVVKVTNIYKAETLRPILPQHELWCGDYSDGRFAWQLDNITNIVPFPVSGKQGLFEVDCEPRQP